MALRDGAAVLEHPPENREVVDDEFETLRRSSLPPRTSAPLAEIDADTVLLGGHRPGSTRSEPVADPPPVLAPARHRFRLGRDVIELRGTVIIGRAPRGPRIGSDEPPVLLGVDSPNQEVSANHLELRETGEAVVVRDLRSTNGSVVHLPDGRRRRLSAGSAMAVPIGSTIDLGDGVLLTLLGRDGGAE